ncbi:MAG: TlpA family protein disulfide reductase [Streptosporangiales bacterium]|nr:TlpA family protein disulfide reductase [Streptosporangiales bacterium]
MAAVAAAAVLLGGCGGGGGTAASSGVPRPPTPVARSASPSLVAKARLATCPRVRPAPPGSKGPALPAVTLPCLGKGPAVAMGGLRGPAVLNLWATWCDPCRAEAPLFQRLHASGAKVRVLGVDSQDTGPDAALWFAIDRNLHYPNVYDAAGRLAVAARAGKGLPVTLFVDRAGKVVHTRFGPYPSYAALTADVHAHLGVRS